MPYDILASIAHARMLVKINILSKKDGAAITNVLKNIQKLELEGKFKLKQKDEDCHTAIENFIVKKLGQTGKKIHTGRSRNDQVLVALRLFSKDYLAEIKKSVLTLAKTILDFAKLHEFIPMPGYTHTQQAMPSSVGQWAGSFVESLLDDIIAIDATIKLTDQNPLGSAAGFGTSIPVDRNYTSKLLGFSRIQINSLYCQNSRGKIESFTISSLAQVMMTLGKIANDMILFTSYEFGFFKIDTSLTTGSSIMPQKQNLDIMEVLRANVSVIFANQSLVQNAGHNLISGYNKDLKITKKALMDSFSLVSSSIAITKLLFGHMEPDKDRLNKAFSLGIFATDEANELALKGMPFRDAYKKIGESLGALKSRDVLSNIRLKKHIGSTGNLRLDDYEEKIKNFVKEKPDPTY